MSNRFIFSLLFLIVGLSLSAQQDFTQKFEDDNDIIMVKWYPMTAMLYNDTSDVKKVTSNKAIREAHSNIVVIGISHQQIKGKKKQQVTREEVLARLTLSINDKDEYKPMSAEELSVPESGAIIRLETSYNNEREDKINIFAFRRRDTKGNLIVKEDKTAPFTINYDTKLFLFMGPVLNRDMDNQIGSAAAEGHAEVDNEIYSTSEVMPRFTGGQVEFDRYLARKIKYPAGAAENAIEGTVRVNFVIEKDGSLSSFKVTNDPGGGLGAEVVRVLKTMPLWMPGYNEGKPVRVKMNTSFEFKLR